MICQLVLGMAEPASQSVSRAGVTAPRRRLAATPISVRPANIIPQIIQCLQDRATRQRRNRAVALAVSAAGRAASVAAEATASAVMAAIAPAADTEGSA